MVSKEEFEPIIDVDINGIEAVAVIDTGSEMCAIAERLSDQIRDQEEPLQGVRVVGAVGAKSKLIKNEVLLEVRFQGIVLEVNAIVLPDLCIGLILGMDLLVDHAAVVDLERGSVILTVNGIRNEFKFGRAIEAKEKAQGKFYLKTMRESFQRDADSKGSDCMKERRDPVEAEWSIEDIRAKLNNIDDMDQGSKQELGELLRSDVTVEEKRELVLSRMKAKGSYRKARHDRNIVPRNM
ncbi:uncharacterized protein LOC124553466 [Schistocerca americana]|uniref:uncharacterized protein LOC124553466 n=1 Tax=Schistocerca americana TaxID=7009 RepID=UPI001F4FF2AF|nr:uncharacterized protein LOC124553466 [Schistocerca americana]